MNYRHLLLLCDEYSMKGQILLFESDVVMELMEFAQETISAALTWPITVITLYISSDSCNSKCCVREVICVVLPPSEASWDLPQFYNVKNLFCRTLLQSNSVYMLFDKNIYVLSLGYGNITLFTIRFCQRRLLLYWLALQFNITKH